jgi:hypothetical protein
VISTLGGRNGGGGQARDLGEGGGGSDGWDGRSKNPRCLIGLTDRQEDQPVPRLFSGVGEIGRYYCAFKMFPNTTL